MQSDADSNDAETSRIGDEDVKKIVKELLIYSVCFYLDKL